MRIEQKGNVAVASLKGTCHQFNEDRYRILSRDVPLVKAESRGEIFAVFDGIGSAELGMRAAQEMCDQVGRFYTHPEAWHSSAEGVHELLMSANLTIHGWGMDLKTGRHRGGCAGSIGWIYEDRLFIFHAGDTMALLIRDGQATMLTHAHEYGGGIYRFFGLGPALEIDVGAYPLEEGDRLLLFSDGVTKAFEPVEAAEVVEAYADMRRAVTELVQRSRLAGSSDDITALLYEHEGIVH